jgi:hypothetical protein
MAKTKASAAPYDGTKQYVVTLNERVTLADHRITLYPGKEYTLRGDLLEQWPDKVKSAREA